MDQQIVFPKDMASVNNVLYHQALEMASDAHKRDDALKLFDQLIAENPLFPPAHLSKAILLVQIGNFHDAIETLHSSGADPSSLSSKDWFFHARALFGVEKFEDALVAINTALKMENSTIEVNERMFLKARILKKLERLDEAIELYDIIIESDPQFYGAYINKGIILESMKIWDEALECYQLCFRLFPQNSEPLLYKGSILYKIKKYEEAISALNSAINLLNSSPELYLRKCQCFKKLGYIINSAVCCQKVLELDVDNFEAFKLKGELIKILRSISESKEGEPVREFLEPEIHSAKEVASTLVRFRKFRIALSLIETLLAIPKVDCFDVLKLKQSCLEELGDFDQALSVCNELILLDPTCADFHFKSGIILHRLKRFEDAVNVFEKAIQIEPYNPLGYCEKADSLMQIGNVTDAIKLYDLAIEVYPECFNAYLGKSSALEELGSLELSLQEYDSTCSKFPKQIRPQFRKALLLLKLHQWARAEDAFEKILQFDDIDESLESMRYKANSLLHLHRYREAVTVFDELVHSSQPLDEEDLLGRVRCFLNMKRLKDALADLAVVKVKNFSPIVRVISLEAEVLFHLGHFNESSSACDVSLAEDPKCIEALLTKSMSLSKLGKPTDALKVINLCIDLNPNNPEALKWKVILLVDLERLMDAVVCFLEVVFLRCINPLAKSGNFFEAHKWLEMAGDIESHFVSKSFDALSGESKLALNDLKLRLSRALRLKEILHNLRTLEKVITKLSHTHSGVIIREINQLFESEVAFFVKFAERIMADAENVDELHYVPNSRLLELLETSDQDVWKTASLGKDDAKVEGVSLSISSIEKVFSAEDIRAIQTKSGKGKWTRNLLLGKGVEDYCEESHIQNCFARNIGRSAALEELMIARVAVFKHICIGISRANEASYECAIRFSTKFFHEIQIIALSYSDLFVTNSIKMACWTSISQVKGIDEKSRKRILQELEMKVDYDYSLMTSQTTQTPEPSRSKSKDELLPGSVSYDP
jgi:tetratricopeptide (TPR) repeat protein